MMEESDKQAPEPPYTVGYGRPPRHTRFRKGRSGNPKGRPKGSKPAKTLLQEALSAPVAVTEGGSTRVIEQRHALFKAMVAKAIKGDVRAAALAVNLMEKFGINRADGEDFKEHVFRWKGDFDG